MRADTFARPKSVFVDGQGWVFFTVVETADRGPNPILAAFLVEVDTFGNVATLHRIGGSQTPDFGIFGRFHYPVSVALK